MSPEGRRVPAAGTASLRVAFAGGGTGGHVVPGLHLLEHLSGAPDASRRLAHLLWFGAGRPVEERVLAGLEARLGGAEHARVVLALEPGGGGAPSLAGLALRLAPAIRRARRELARHESQVLVGLGGFTTVPAVLAARSLRVPIVLLEINAVPGRATRWLARFAARVFHAWPASVPAHDPRHVHVGPPLPRGFGSAREGAEKAGAGTRARFGLDPARPVLLVLGGSQGALGLNRFLAREAARLTAGGLQVVHQVGPGRLAEAAPERPGYRALEYLDDVPDALAAATLVLCRGGASTLAEVGAMRCPAVVVPYPHHPDRHQEANAAQLGDGVRVVREEELDSAYASELVRLGSEGGLEERQAMARALAGALPLDAGERIARALFELAPAG